MSSNDQAAKIPWKNRQKCIGRSIIKKSTKKLQSLQKMACDQYRLLDEEEKYKN